MSDPPEGGFRPSRDFSVFSTFVVFININSHACYNSFVGNGHMWTSEIK